MQRLFSVRFLALRAFCCYFIIKKGIKPIFFSSQWVPSWCLNNSNNDIICLSLLQGGIQARPWYSCSFLEHRASHQGEGSKPCSLGGKCMSQHQPLYSIPPTYPFLSLRALQCYKLRVKAWILQSLISAGRYPRLFFSGTCSTVRICPYGSYFSTKLRDMDNTWHNQLQPLKWPLI